MPEHKDVTIYDIAARLNLSPTTVSRALKDHPAISKSTKGRVKDLAIAMGYRSNTFASNLRSKRTYTLGVIVQKLTSNFLASVLAGMENLARQEGYNLIISQSLERVENEIANARTLFNARVDGLLASLSYETDQVGHFESFIDKGIPVVFFDRVHNDDRCLSVVIDNYKAGFDVTQHLISQGCKRIMHVTGSLKRNVYADRYRGYRDALQEAGIKPQDDLLIVNDMSEESGIQVAEEILRRKLRPDGLFVSGDAAAAFCMKTLRKAGMQVPEDIAIAGFNDDPISLVAEPNLTTVHYPGKTLGEAAASHLIASLNGHFNIRTTNTIVIRSELVVRESSLRK